MKFTFAPESRPLEGYTIKRAIHRGGFGEVYFAISDAGREVVGAHQVHRLAREDAHAIERAAERRAELGRRERLGDLAEHDLGFLLAAWGACPDRYGGH